MGRARDITIEGAKCRVILFYHQWTGQRMFKIYQWPEKEFRYTHARPTLRQCYKNARRQIRAWRRYKFLDTIGKLYPD